jgi:hypothetical protein
LQPLFACLHICQVNDDRPARAAALHSASVLRNREIASRASWRMHASNADESRVQETLQRQGGESKSFTSRSIAARPAETQQHHRKKGLQRELNWWLEQLNAHMISRDVKEVSIEERRMGKRKRPCLPLCNADTTNT